MNFQEHLNEHKNSWACGFFEILVLSLNQTLEWKPEIENNIKKLLFGERKSEREWNEKRF